jgi:hypothetical protein
MRRQGWPSLVGADDDYRRLLEAEVLKNTDGAKAWVKCLPGWVEDLRRYALVRPRPQSALAASSGPRPAARALIAACPACDEYGWLLDDDDTGPQLRCTHPGVTLSEVEAAK